MKTIATVESFTGGLFAATIVQRPGASAFFKGGLVTYTNDVKAKFKINTQNGVINAATARAMARVGKTLFDVDLCVAFTGNAGPSALENKPVGLVYIAFNERVYELNFTGTRSEIITGAVNFALKKAQLGSF